jgi:tRNA threonylcarbamoyladenosine biosynthesis protein TsaB
VILLALESSTDSCSVALWDAAARAAGAPIAFDRSDRPRGQADRLVELAEEAMGQAGLDYRALHAIAVNHGPGSFTGVRSAVAAARGFAFAANLPVLAVSGLEALAGLIEPCGDALVVAAIDARRGQVYAQAFAPGLRPLAEPRALSPARVAEEIGDRACVLAGSGAPLVAAALRGPARVMMPQPALDARAIARRAAQRLASGEAPQPGFAVRPLYLREPDARPAASPLPALAVAG